MNWDFALWVLLAVAGFFLAPLWAVRAMRAQVRREMVEYLRETLQDAEIADEEDGGIDLKTAKHDVQINLENLFRMVLALRPNTRESRRELYERFTASLRSPDNLEHLTIEEHGPRILPRIVNHDFLHEVENHTLLPMRAIGFTGLSVAYILDSEHYVTYLSRQHTESLGLDDRALHELALSNLRKIFKPEAAEAAFKGQAISVVQTFDDHDAARMLLVPEHLSEDQTLAAFIPDKGTLILAPAPVDGDWAALHKFDIGITPLYDRPLKITHHGISVVPLSD